MQQPYQYGQQPPAQGGGFPPRAFPPQQQQQPFPPQQQLQQQPFPQQQQQQQQPQHPGGAGAAPPHFPGQQQGAPQQAFPPAAAPGAARGFPPAQGQPPSGGFPGAPQPYAAGAPYANVVLRGGPAQLGGGAPGAPLGFAPPPPAQQQQQQQAQGFSPSQLEDIKKGLQARAHSRDAQRNMLGEILYPRVSSRAGQLLAGKITGMLLELTTGEVLQLLGDEVAMANKIQEAQSVLDSSTKRP